MTVIIIILSVLAWLGLGALAIRRIDQQDKFDSSDVGMAAWFLLLGGMALVAAYVINPGDHRGLRRLISRIVGHELKSPR